ncbi:NADH-quinone oxidoreductase subunit G [Chromatiales bacterium (ex Bugula neritina AB1)]|nr:NADH-quinone oxidoreductase subunit G [Chromatiales bacterium (ex Bugula neritina AB1)]
MSDDLINITVDGKPLQARKGQMLIEVTDAAGIEIPRFCYHKKLSVAANCRMCLVEVEKAPKPLPACATPVMPDMVVKTKSELATGAQQGTMEFLLINHPLDCPICDQGGECELQDVAMGYGNSSSDYIETKRVVMDKNIGPLISTELTRCIHCTRCVRFGEEIAGVRELGATGRGENMRIGTYIAKSVDSELSGNVIDLCPVGALTAKPSRFSARSWELTQHATVSPHDSVGSNLYVHVDNGSVARAVPRENETINETWISDRDRFSYEGLYTDDRITSPMLRIDGELKPVDWPTALSAAAKALQESVEKSGPKSIAALGSAQSTLEEQYLLQKLMRALGSNNIDHRLSQIDYSDQQQSPVMPWLGMALEDLEKLDSALLIGSNIRKEQPLAALRLRKASLKGATISLINPRVYPMNFETQSNIGASPRDLLLHLLAVALACDCKEDIVTALASQATIEDSHRAIADSLGSGENTAVLLGNSSVMHPEYASIRSLASCIANATGAVFGYLPEGGNTAGAWLAGCVPHRTAGGVATESIGLNAAQMLDAPLGTLLLMGVEPRYEQVNSALARKQIANATTIIISTHLSRHAVDHADVVLPSAAFSETAGTFVNAVGAWQMFNGAAPPPGEGRPGWKILRVLGNELGLDGFDYQEITAVRDELKNLCREIELDNSYTAGAVELPPQSSDTKQLIRCGDLPAYKSDMLVRRARSLQKTADSKQNVVGLNSADMTTLNLEDNAVVSVGQDESTVLLKVVQDDGVPRGCAWLPIGSTDVAGFGSLFQPVTLVPGS